MSNFTPSDLVRLVIGADQAGTRLDALLAQQFPEHSRVRLRQVIAGDEARVNDQRCKAAYRVREGDVVTLRIPPRPAAGPEPEAIALDVLYEDSRIVVINKPHGMVVHPAKGHWQGTLAAAIAHRFGPLSQLGGATRPGIVHRLDRDTSGVIVIARDDQTHLHLSRQFERRTIEKEYFAICRGQIDRDRDRIEQPIGPHPYQREKMAIRAEHPASRAASTFFEVQERFAGFFTVRIFPKTGRTHQIRVHFAHLGCPILCDPLYSGHKQVTRGELAGRAVDDQVVLRRLALHARRLSFDHPEDGRRVTFEAPLPDELELVLTLLRTLRAA